MTKNKIQGKPGTHYPHKLSGNVHGAAGTTRETVSCQLLPGSMLCTTATLICTLQTDILLVSPSNNSLAMPFSIKPLTQIRNRRYLCFVPVCPVRTPRITM